MWKEGKGCTFEVEGRGQRQGSKWWWWWWREGGGGGRETLQRQKKEADKHHKGRKSCRLKLEVDRCRYHGWHGVRGIGRRVRVGGCGGMGAEG